MSFAKMKLELVELISKSDLIKVAWVRQCWPDRLSGVSPSLVQKSKDIYSISYEYERWYSKALVVVRQLVPERIDDFVGCYKYAGKSDRGKDVVSSFRVSDALAGKVVKQYGDIIAGMGSTYAYFDTQCSILKSAHDRIESSLYEIKQIIQADLFDSEVEAAKELNKKGFSRAAGAMAGVVLEKHLKTVLNAHSLTLSKKNVCINDYNQKLKDESVIDVPTWRFIQRLGDLRNLCDHDKGSEPRQELIAELIDGVDRIMKTVA